MNHAPLTISEHRSSPNFGEREGSIDFIVLHYTGMASEDAAINWLCTPESQVSCHYLIRENGDLVEIVDEKHRAWHAGKSYWHGEVDINSRSIGIEIANGGHEFGCPPFPRAQIEVTMKLVNSIMARHQISPLNVLGHSDIAPERKRDPGEWFPWSELAEEGLCLWVPPAPISEQVINKDHFSGSDVIHIQTQLEQAGYEISGGETYCPGTIAAVRSFQRRHRPERVNGFADGSTIKTLQDWLSLVRKHSIASNSLTG